MTADEKALTSLVIYGAKQLLPAALVDAVTLATSWAMDEASDSGSFEAASVALAKGRRQWMIDWLSDVEQRLVASHEREAQVVASLRSLADEVAASARSDNHRRLLDSYQLEAVRSADKRRAQLLAEAAPHAMRMKQPIDQLIRIERALRTLEFGDVLHLRRLLRFEASYDGPPAMRPFDLHRHLMTDSLAALGLLQTLCVREWQEGGLGGGGMDAEVTALGRWVVAATESALDEAPCSATGTDAIDDAAARGGGQRS